MSGASNRLLLLSFFSTRHPPLHHHFRRLSPPLLSHSRSFSLTPLPSPHSRSSTFTNPHRCFHSHSSSTDLHHNHPWPEWSHLLVNLSAAGYNQPLHDSSLAADGLPDTFAHAARLCLGFAAARPGLLRLLSPKDLEVVVRHGIPFLFQNGHHSATRMTSFLHQDPTTRVLDTETAQTLDLMRFVLSYAASPGGSNLYNRELVESSVRNLLAQMAKLCYSVPESNSSGRNNDRGSNHLDFGNKIEMKRGDWICSRCSFMNFAKNMECLECNEARPNRQVTGSEWECPQCEFFNYGRNMVCLRCDCKRPAEVSIGTNRNSLNVGFDKGSDANTAATDSRLATNEEKAQRWFSKINQLDSSTSDRSPEISDNDFPEIMPLRKGVNRFVVSTRKTPLERRLANAQYQRNMDSDETKDLQMGNQDKSLGAKSNNAPLVSLDADVFRNIPDNSYMEEIGKRDQNESGNDHFVKSEKSRSEKSMSEAGIQNKDKEEADKSSRWFKRVAELHNVADLPSSISDEDFPEIMPVRKGENRFMLSKKKDRSLASPSYKRGMDQANSNNYVPFVPFPPDYFTKVDNSQTSGTTTDTNNSIKSTPGMRPENPPSESSEKRPGKLNYGQSQQQKGSQERHVANSKSRYSEENFEKKWTSSVNGPPTIGNSAFNISSPSGSTDRMNSGSSGNYDKTVNLHHQSSEPKNRQAWTGKSLEGSAVKETNPLDMSEEAKAERWFKRVAQIKDISELSQIPDEDFPSIMPMRKGVNRFVVSKRKTPLERRLTSPQYRRTLPVMNSDPGKKDDTS